MSIRLQSGIVTAAGTVTAIWAGYSLATEEYLPPVLLAGVVAAALLAWKGIRYEVAMVSVCLFCYIVGNRGFAQVMLIPNVPLLVAELVLGASLFVLMFAVATTKVTPVRKDGLNFAVLAWLIFGGVRLCIDLRVHGVMALRDSAMCYYALFFFLGQSIGADPAARPWMHRALIASLAVLPVCFAAWMINPDFFMAHVVFRGVPLILYKADIAATILAAGVFYFFHWAQRGVKLAWLGVAVNFAGAVLPLTRAALLGLAVGLGWHAVARRWQLAGAILALGLLGALGETAVAFSRDRSFRDTRTYQIAQYAASILPFVDPRAIEVKSGDVKGNPIDNNLFRLIWWRTVAEETYRDRPFFGMGFGYDLATQFLSEYGLMGDTEFTARSPHSILLSAFGRMGFFGAAALLGVVFALAAKTVRAAVAWRHDRNHSEAITLWIMCWAIFVSACFGVVLEGPMGAVVFWTLLGLANAASAEDADARSLAAGAEAPRSLNARIEPAEVATSP